MPPADDESPNGLSGHLAPRTFRHDEHRLSTRLDARDDLRGPDGTLLLGAVVFAVDVATGIQSGLAVLDRDLWIVTTDLAVQLTAPVRVGPVRVDAEVVRSGATTVVARCEVWDEGAERRVGAGTGTGRPFPFEFDRGLLVYPIGREVGLAAPPPEPDRPVLERLGVRPVGEDGSVELDLRPWVCNPWGILHGGATAMLAEAAARAALGALPSAGASSGPAVRATGATLRYLAQARSGPVRAVPRVLGAGDGRHLVEVEIRDRGADDRLCALATVEVLGPPAP